MVKIAPSILSADFARLGEEVKAAEDAGADMLHIDIMDGHFVPNLTIGSGVVSSLRKVSRLPFDVHLMIDNPELFVDDFIKAGADIVTVHCEATVHLHRLVQHIKERGAKAGVSINPATPVGMLEDILPTADMVLIMSVNPGFGGQEFITHTLFKLKRLKKMLKDSGFSIPVEVDGGVKPENAKEVVSAGADILVMGSAFFNSGDYRATMEKINGILGNG